MKRKIKVKNTIVDMDGDEMTRIIWAMVKEKLLLPYLDLPLETYDLHIKHRDDTDDQVTTAAARAVLKHGLGVKCATITADAARVREYDLKHEWKSPNATIRGILDGTVFRSPILARNIVPSNRYWKKAIHVGRHANGDVYKNQEIRVPAAGRAEIVFTPADGGEAVRKTIHDFESPGVVQGIHNTDASIASFAKACFAYGYDRKVDVWFSAKDTISKTYDSTFRSIFRDEFDRNWKNKFESAGLNYFYSLIDDMVARIMKTEGGILWACKNYDGDVMSDMLASAYGSLAMMTSVLVSPQQCFMYEAAHGTVQRHYYEYMKGKKTSTNPMAIIFAWTGCIKKRGELDHTPEVTDFARKVELSAVETIESGIMTGDLMKIAEGHKKEKPANIDVFLEAVKERLISKI